MEGIFSKLPMLAISRGVRKPRPTSMARSCFWLFADRLALSSEILSTPDRNYISAPKQKYVNWKGAMG